MLQTLREKGFFHLVSANALTQGIAFLASIFLTKLLTPAELGATRVIQSYFLVLFVLGGAGMAAAVLRFAAVEDPETAPESVFSHGSRRGFLQGALIAVLIAGFALTIGVSPIERLNAGLAVFAIAIPFSVLSDIGIQYLQARHRAKEVAWISLMNRSAAAVFALAGAYMAGFWGWVAGGVLTWVFSAITATQKIGFSALRQTPVSPQGLGSFAAMALLGNGILAVSQSLDFFLLDRLVSDRTEIGKYAFAVLFLMAATQLSGAIQAIVIPMLTQRHREIDWLRKSTLKYQGGYAVMAALAAIAMFGIVTALVSIDFEEYAGAQVYVAILMIRFVSLAGSAVCVAAMLALGDARRHVAALALGTLFALFFSWWATSIYGVMGTAWGQALGGLFTAICQWAAFFLALRQAKKNGPDNDSSPLAGFSGP
ncbi:MAG TPA: oligosaccharide flippase family protein [Fimbriimonadaceae bacterium]|nr:oligosaccharide flippase family protein [Fimbriimonadaceae bacterium]